MAALAWESADAGPKMGRRSDGRQDTSLPTCSHWKTLTRPYWTAPSGSAHAHTPAPRSDPRERSTVRKPGPAGSWEVRVFAHTHTDVQTRAQRALLYRTAMPKCAIRDGITASLAIAHELVWGSKTWRTRRVNSMVEGDSRPRSRCNQPVSTHHHQRPQLSNSVLTTFRVAGSVVHAPLDLESLPTTRNATPTTNREPNPRPTRHPTACRSRHAWRQTREAKRLREADLSGREVLGTVVAPECVELLVQEREPETTPLLLHRSKLMEVFACQDEWMQGWGPTERARAREVETWKAAARQSRMQRQRGADARGANLDELDAWTHRAMDTPRHRRMPHHDAPSETPHRRTLETQTKQKNKKQKKKYAYTDLLPLVLVGVIPLDRAQVSLAIEPTGHHQLPIHHSHGCVPPGPSMPRC